MSTDSLHHRLATRDDIVVLTALMNASIGELQKPFLTDAQIASSRAIMGLDTQLIDDGTYFVVEQYGFVAACGGWSRRATLYGGDSSPGRDVAPLDPAKDAARVRAMYTHLSFTRRGLGRLILTLCEDAAHVAGERMFVDFAGQTMEVFDGTTGEARRAEIFVAVLGASSYTYAEAVWSQSLPEWISAHVNALAFFDGVPRQIVCDNLRSGITRACFYEPLVNRTYADMARHYGTTVIPARPYKARDKAKVEVGVQVVQRWILARLRHRRFFSLAELNSAIRALLGQLNDRPMRGWGTTRRALYQQVDRPALQQLPPTHYEYAEWKRCRVNLDYHVEIERHYYSVPFQLLRQTVEARITAKSVEIFHRGKLVATHLRSPRRHRPSTVPDHMPSSHRRYRDWTNERIRREAAAIGDDAEMLIDLILRSRPHPEQGFRSCIGILRLEKRYGAERLDAACARALALGTRSYTSVAAILNNRQDRKRAETELPSLFHENIRGPGYYH